MRVLTAFRRQVLVAALLFASAPFLPASTSVSALAADAPRVPLAERLRPDVLAAVWPNAERLGKEEGGVPAISVYKGADLIGFIYSTLDVVRAPGYSGIPFDIIAGIELSGRLVGAKVIAHSEAHISDTKMQGKLDTFLSRLPGRPDSAPLQPDFVAGATVSARTMKAAIADAGRVVLRAHSPRPPVTQPTLDVQGFRPMVWEDLLKEGGVVARRVTNTELPQLVEGAAGPGAKPETAADTRTDTYIELTAALATPAAIGQNVLGASYYNANVEKKPPGTMTIFIGSTGTYDFLGNSYHQKAKGYRFDRFQIVQGERTFTFDRDDFQRVDQRTLPKWTDYGGLFYLKPDSGFDPLKSWRLDLFIRGTTAAGGAFTATVPVEYKIPAAHVLVPEPEPVPAWVEAWQGAKPKVAVLGAALSVLTLIFLFQGWLARHRRLHRIVRLGFLAFTLVWLGWVAGGQLSTIHVMNYALAPFRHFDIGFYLAEPLIFMVAAYALVGVILIGRGVFCGWLCPFGAMQELLATVARWLRLPQWNPSERVQRKLWLVKYVAAAGVVTMAFVWPEMESTAAEVEPFKTAITSIFTRPWPYEVYAVALLLVGLFTERAFCRFLCPLGGVLALLDRFHLVDMLKRRPECGSPCHLCERSCPVKAIERSGKIKMAECFQCLDCQVEYHDDHRCPPLAHARKLRQRPPVRRPVAMPVPVGTRTSTVS